VGNLLYYVNPPPRLPWNDYQYTEYFASLDGLSVTENGGSVTLDYSKVSVAAETTDGDEALLLKDADLEFPSMTWAKRRTFKTKACWIFEASSGGTANVGTGSFAHDSFFGFQVIDGKLECISKATGGETTVEVADWSGGAFEEETILEARYFPGSRIEFYLDGTLATAITTNLPDNNAYASRSFEIYAKTTADGEKKEISVSMIMVHQKP